MLWIAGIGASAGGLDAAQRLLSCLPRSGQLVCVLANHQAERAHTEILVRHLGRATSDWQVVMAGEITELQAGTVYVLPAGRDGRIEGDRLLLQPPSEQALSSPSVDVLLTSIAEARGSRAAAVILSGTGTDGAAGCRAVRARGGRVYAQSDARFDGMPRAAAISDAELGTVEWIAHGLVPDRPTARAQGTMEPPKADLEKLIELVLRRTGVDFQGYKPETLDRRARSRMVKVGCATLGDYVAYARETPDELETLQAQFLVSLSSFFRDPECFEALGLALRETVHRGHPISVWVPGCATGEEAYSLAMLILDLAGPAPARVRVWGTDLNREALQVAQRGRYDQVAIKGLSPRRVERYFRSEGEGYQIGETLAEICSFRCENVLSGTDVQHDLISCRNLLIYLQVEQQFELLKAFHRGLQPEGLLFLAPTETIGPAGSSLFRVVDLEHRIFRRRGGLGRVDIQNPAISGPRAPL